VRTDLVRRDGRGRYGARVTDHAPDGRWHPTTWLAALRVTGLTAPAVFDGPIDGPSFLAYIEQIRVPTLTADDIVIMDHLSCHKSAAVRRAIEAVGAQRWFLPKYRDVRWATIGASVPRFEPAACRNYFRHCGYSAATGLWNPL